MSGSKVKRWPLFALAALMVLAAAGVVGYRFAVGILKEKVVEALGPTGEIRDIKVLWSRLDVEGLRIRGSDDWPAADVLKADRVILVPSLRSFFSRQYRINSITIVNPYLSIYRTRHGKVLMIPGLLTEKKGAETRGNSVATKPAVTIGEIALTDGMVDLYDASVAKPPVKIRLEKIQAHIEDLEVPTFRPKSRFDLEGLVKGVHTDGQVALAGWAIMSTKDSSMKLTLRSVDLVTLQPYLIKAGDTRVQKGTLDLDLQSDISNNRLKAPGKITLTDLKLAPAKGIMGTFMGVPRDAVLAFLKGKGDRITLNFVLQGDISNPKFTLHEAFSDRLAVSMAELFKVSIGGVAKGAATLGEKGVEAASGAVKGVGGALQELFGGQRKH